MAVVVAFGLVASFSTACFSSVSTVMVDVPLEMDGSLAASSADAETLAIDINGRIGVVAGEDEQPIGLILDLAAMRSHVAVFTVHPGHSRPPPGMYDDRLSGTVRVSRTELPLIVAYDLSGRCGGREINLEGTRVVRGEEMLR